MGRDYDTSKKITEQSDGLLRRWEWVWVLPLPCCFNLVVTHRHCIKNHSAVYGVRLGAYRIIMASGLGDWIAHGLAPLAAIHWVWSCWRSSAPSRCFHLPRPRRSYRTGYRRIDWRADCLGNIPPHLALPALFAINAQRPATSSRSVCRWRKPVRTRLRRCPFCTGEPLFNRRADCTVAWFVSGFIYQ